MKKAIMIGAGNIGRGFIGMLLERSGYHVLFADINETVVEEINKRREYTVYMVDEECIDTIVRNISAVSSASPALIAEIADCGLVCTAVGLTALPKISPVLTAGIRRRKMAGNDEPFNIIACENAVRASSILKSCVYSELDDETKLYADSLVGFPDCAVDRIIPPARGENVTDVVVERYHEWDVEKKSIKGDLPLIEGMTLVDDLTAYLERKLFTLNGPNAVTAYMGYLKGYKTINEALTDTEIYETVCGMMEECSEMLQLRHGFSENEMREYIKLLLARFKNPYIIDDVERVAREPIRKLSPNDRIIAPMNYAHGYGINTPYYYKGLAAAFNYDNPADEQSQHIHAMIKENGLIKTIVSICGVSESEAEKIEREYIHFKLLPQKDGLYDY